MNNELIFICDRSGNLINDPEQSVKYATNLSWETLWPKGYGPCSFAVKRDIVAQWAVKQAYEMVIRDGQRIVYQGRLNNLNRSLNENTEQIDVLGTGWYVVLVDRQMHKRWIDKSPISRLEDAVTNNDTQNSFVVDRKENFMQVRLADKEDLSRAGTERHRTLYTAPTGTKVRRVTFDWKRRTGEGVIIQVFNVDTGLSEWSTSGTDATGSADITFATAANKFEFRIGPTASDLYDINDYGYVDSVVVYGQMTFASGSPAYTYYADEVIKDLLNAKASEISTDYTNIGSPAIALSPFITESDDYEMVDTIIQRAVAYGDASYNSWGFSIWDESGASDGKPQAVFEARSLADYEYAMHLADLDSFSDEETDDELINYVVVRYRDDKNITRYRTPDDNASLKDTTSISDYGQRDETIDAEQADATRADQIGIRYLTYHKNPLRKTRLSVKGEIRTKVGIWVPANRVRAGQRIKVPDYNGGQTYFLRHTDYNADSRLLQMSPDLPPNDFVIFMEQQKLK